MLKSIFKTSGYIACLAWSGIVCAMGLGEINVSSNLGQPLKAEIELVSVDKADKSSINAKLASAEAFKNAGIDYPYALPKLKFEVANRDNGDPYIKVTSPQAVNEPFVTLLIEVTWSTGKLMREYTFLLDPADFNPQVPKEAVKPIEPVVMIPTTPVAPVNPAPAITPTVPAVVAPTPITQAPVSQALSPAQPATINSAQPEKKNTVPLQEETSVAKQKAAPAVEDEVSKAAEGVSEEQPAPETPISEEPITVVRGDSLSKIALKTKPAEISLDRMLVALYRANADAFVDHNMNRLKTGKIIRLPDAKELEAIDQSEAVKEVHAQVVDWNAYRQQLSSVRTESREQVGNQESSGKVTSAVIEKSPVSKEASKGVLKLSKGEVSDEAVVGGVKVAAQDKANAKAEAAIAKNKALKETQERAAILEKNVKDLQRLAELKKNASSGKASSGVAAASSVVATGKPKAAAPKAVQPPAAVVETSFLDDVLEDPIKLAGIVAVLLALGGAGFVVVRRRGKNKGDAEKQKREKSDTDDLGATTVHIAEPIVPSPETGDFTQTAFSDASATSNADEVDPIGEADLFLTFGRDAQAEAVLKEALVNNPGNIQVKLKLLSIYSNRKDTNSFLSIAREIKDSGDKAVWGQAEAMGRELEPSNPFYGGDGSSSAPVAESKTKAAEASVDFDLGFGSTNPAIKTGQDFMKAVVEEQSNQDKTTVLSAAELSAVKESPMDFDITGTHPDGKQEGGAEASPLFNMDEMMFDITSSRKSGATNAATPNTSTKPDESNLNDLIFDVTTTAPKGHTAAAATPAIAPGADDGLAFTLDFPTELTAGSTAKTAPPADIGFGGISLNLDGLASSDSSSKTEVKDERWQEVATKLDLAKAYQEMGDAAGTKEILEEVLRDGDEQQRESAQAMLQQL